ncbi:MAG TPA: UDP-N-acetylglucosamine 1-carboxyvinyltransferase [Armatimonadetes bacterium]|nr:UDP-N-acetylglucosamine 1-carboxyvinyltransferase [Armatimonadota bacterium]
MEKIYIVGGKRLLGDVRVSGSKNGTLAIMAGALLAKGTTILEDTPCIGDIQTMVEMLQQLGVHARMLGKNRVEIDATEIKNCEAPYDLVKKMRASFCVTGPILARCGYARVPMPGGCDIGARPVDFHVKGLQALGATVNIEHGYVEAEADKLHGAPVYLDFPSAGATQHIMTVACLAEGITRIENAALEPEVVGLANFLIAMGAKISGAGTGTIEIEGVKELRGINYKVIPDRMEAGTLAIAAGITRGEIVLSNVTSEHCTAVFQKLQETGIHVFQGPDFVSIKADARPLATDVKTMPHPGFPTDMQQPFSAMLAVADGTSVVSENVYERRFRYVAELQRMGAEIVQEGRTAIIKGVPKLTGAEVTASDLRAGAALIVAGLAAEGRSEISGLEHVDRGYEDIMGKLASLGADIVRMGIPPEAAVKLA